MGRQMEKEVVHERWKRKPGQEAERLQKEMEEVEGQIQTTVEAEVKKTIHVQLREVGGKGWSCSQTPPLKFVICVILTL